MCCTVFEVNKILNCFAVFFLFLAEVVEDGELHFFYLIDGTRNHLVLCNLHGESVTHGQKQENAKHEL
jgi:hypothetical protein